MKLNKLHQFSNQHNLKVSSRSIAFHQAGHVAAIYLYNIDKNVPPVFFQIMHKDIKCQQDQDSTLSKLMDDGRLIQSLPHTSGVAKDYMAAIEAGIVNLLIGPLAEAKYVYQRDNELFTDSLVNMTSLNYYGGRDKVSLAYDYLQSLYSNKQQQDEKIHQLFNIAFNFVKDQANWQAIIHLADYIYESNKNIIRNDRLVSELETIETKNSTIPVIHATGKSIFLQNFAYN